MVSLLWKACSEGNLQNVQELLKEATPVDIEIKDPTGATPLIEAVKNGHVEVIRALLDKGADPTNGSSQGQLEQYTSDPIILELLNYTQNKTIANGITSHEPIYAPEADDCLDKRYGYGPSPHIMYPYYPSLNSVPPQPEGSVYYPQSPASQPTGENSPSGGVGNLPPPEVARFIPCRYFPACRYGASCIFAHPQTPYFPGPVPPPPQYITPYDPMSIQPYPPNYYPPPPFQSPANGPHMPPLSPAIVPHPGHVRSPSEAILPAQGPPFTPNGVHPPLPYGPMSPQYSHTGQSSVPMAISPLPPLPPQASLSTPSPSNMYNTPFIQHDAIVQYPVPQSTHANMVQQDVNDETKQSSNHHLDVASPVPNHPPHRDGMGHHRRGGARRGSFGGRKPPCLFFPAGRCKNGDDCRFPHVLPDNSGTHHQTYFSGRGNGRQRNPNGHGFATINEEHPGPTIQDDASHNSNHFPSGDSGRTRYSQSAKNNYAPNGVRSDKKLSTLKQRVPNADEFPVLAGSITPPTRSPGTNGVLSSGNTPTAAQVLQAPPPLRKDSFKDSSPATPDSSKPASIKVEPNGVISVAPTHDPPVAKLPVSFAAAAAPEMPKEITLSA